MLAPQPATERRSLRISGVSALAAVGTTNDGVIAFTGVPTYLWGTPYRISSQSIDPTANSGVWMNIVQSAAFGTTFKFLRRGVYRFDVFAPLSPQGGETPLGVAMALQLDSAATSLVATGNYTPQMVNRYNDAGVIGMTYGAATQVAVAPGINFGGTVAIPDSMCGGGSQLPQLIAGETGTGVVRLHANDTAGGVISSQFGAQGVNLSLWCTSCGDLAG